MMSDAIVFWVSTGHRLKHLAMTYMHYAVVNEICPICGQRRILVAAEEDGKRLFVMCEDCESQWDEPTESYKASSASRDRHTFSRYLNSDELIGHLWQSHVLNVGRL